MSAGLDVYHADPAPTIATAGEEPNDLDHDLSEVRQAWVDWKSNMNNIIRVAREGCE